MLRIENLSKTYADGTRALRGIDLEIPRGLFGLLGPNGAGKSSLMRTLATLQDADEGTAFLGDLDLLRDKSSARRCLGYLPQDFGLYPRVDAETMLHHFASLKGIRTRAQRRESVERLLRLTNLWQVRKRKLGTFSGGMRQRFGIAQALLGDPRLIIVDEPTTGLDPEERRRFLNLLAEIGERAVVLLSTHLVADVRELCGALAVIQRGQVLEKGAPAELVAALEGRVWRAKMPTDRFDGEGQGARLLSTHLDAGATVLRVECGSRPGPEFSSVPPNLEDVYFSVLAPPRSTSTGAAVRVA